MAPFPPNRFLSNKLTIAQINNIMPSFNIVRRGSDTSFTFKLENSRYKLKEGESFESLDEVKRIVTQGQQSWDAADKLVAGYEIGVMVIRGGEHSPIVVLHDNRESGMTIKQILSGIKSGVIAVDVSFDDVQDFKELVSALGATTEEGKEMGLRKLVEIGGARIVTKAKQNMNKVRMADLKGWQDYV